MMMAFVGPYIFTTETPPADVKQETSSENQCDDYLLYQKESNLYAVKIQMGYVRHFVRSAL